MPWEYLHDTQAAARPPPRAGTETTEQCFAIGHNEWRAFVTDCGLAVPPTATPSIFPPAATTTYTVDGTSPSSSGPAPRVPPLPLGGAATQIGTGSGANPSSNPAGATLKRQASMTGLLQQADAAFLAANYKPDKQSAEGQVCRCCGRERRQMAAGTGGGHHR